MYYLIRGKPNSSLLVMLDSLKYTRDAIHRYRVPTTVKVWGHSSISVSSTPILKEISKIRIDLNYCTIKSYIDWFGKTHEELSLESSNSLRIQIVNEEFHEDINSWWKLI